MGSYGLEPRAPRFQGPRALGKRGKKGKERKRKKKERKKEKERERERKRETERKKMKERWKGRKIKEGKKTRPYTRRQSRVGAVTKKIRFVGEISGLRCTCYFLLYHSLSRGGACIRLVVIKCAFSRASNLFP